MAIASQAAKTLLFVDDEPSFRDFVARSLGVNGYRVVSAPHWDEARNMLRKGNLTPDVIFVDTLSLKRDLREVVGETASIPVVVLSADRDAASIVRAMRSGARNYICKPVTPKEIDRVVSEMSAVSDVESRAASVPEAVTHYNPRPDFVFCSPKMQQLHQMVMQIADARVPVLILGESGVGKDVVARSIHRNSRLVAKPFVKVNCAALPAELTESELFGYQKGAFTGADIDRPGKFEFANGGTIFLDEIAEFTPGVQAKLLQVLQDGRFTRLGSNQEISVDVRIIAATNRRLEEAIRNGRFRQDLYYRLNVVTLDLPPLRERREEILELSRYFLIKYGQEFKSGVTSIPHELKDAFMAYHWPGNVRELENTIKRFMVLQDTDAIRQELEARTSKQTSAEIDALADTYIEASDDDLDLKEISRKAALTVEKSMIVKTLNKTSWNKWRAAKELRVSYKTLLSKIEQHDIKPAMY